MDAPGEVALTAAAVPRRRRFIAFHRADRNFFLAFLFVCWIGVLMGFVPAVVARFNGHALYVAPPVLKLHAIAFSGWLALLTAQILLVRRKRTALHMKLGMAGVVLVPVMAVTAYFSEVQTQRWHAAHPPDNYPFFIVTIFWVTAFSLLAGAALVARKNPGAHKRLILFATAVIVGAAYDRWWGDALTAAFGDGLGGMLVNEYAATDLILFAALAYDLWTRHRLHPVYEIVVPAILAAEIGTTFIYHFAGWPAIAASMIGR
jgi:uncharacterized membrane protein